MNDLPNGHCGVDRGVRPSIEVTLDDWISGPYLI